MDETPLVLCQHPKPSIQYGHPPAVLVALGLMALSPWALISKNSTKSNRSKLIGKLSDSDVCIISVFLFFHHLICGLPRTFKVNDFSLCTP